MWRKFVRSSPSLYANSLPEMTWKEGEEQMVDKFADELQQNISLLLSKGLCFSCGEAFRSGPTTQRE